MPNRNLTVKEISSLAYQAGFRGSALTWAVAVALAESGGNPTAYNPELGANTPKGGGSRGLWQIYGTAHPEYNNSSMFNPQANAKAAYAVYRQAGGSFRPWSTFKNGSAAKFLKGISGSISVSSDAIKSAMIGATGTIAAERIPTPGQRATSPLSQLSILPDNISKFLSAPDLNMTLLFILLGTLFVIMGMVLLFGTNSVAGAKFVFAESGRAAGIVKAVS